MYGAAAHRSPEHTPTSPSRHRGQSGYSPQNFNAPTIPPHYRGQPTSPSVTSLPPLNGFGAFSQKRSSSTFYDPTSETIERKSQHSFNYPPPRNERRSFDRDHPLPLSSHPSQPLPIHGHPPQASPLGAPDQHQYSPVTQKHFYHRTMGPPSVVGTSFERTPSNTPPIRVADPMSFSNILSTSDPPPPNDTLPLPKASETSSMSSGIPKFHEKDHQSRLSSNPESPVAKHKFEETVRDDSIANGVPKANLPCNTPTTGPYQIEEYTNPPGADNIVRNGDSKSFNWTQERHNRPKVIVSEKDFQTALAKINAMELSDVEDPAFEEQKMEYARRRAKRLREVDDLDLTKRKRRRIAYISKLATTSGHQATSAKERYIQTHEQSAWSEIQAAELADEKERKKIMQRTRRRENTKQKAEQQVTELKQKAQQTADRVEQEKLLREAHKQEKKVHETTLLLNRPTPIKELGEVTPPAPNMEGGIMSSFQMDDQIAQGPPKKKSRAGGRLKKSKEQKQAEKDNAAAAHAAMERGDEFVMIAPKGESRDRVKREPSLQKESTSGGHIPAASNVYNQLYEQIWRDISRNSIHKIYRIKENSLATKQSNLRKTGQLAAKEARRWQLKTNKNTKDNQARAKRVMREMLSFWKRNEREERDQRKMAEKLELDNAKKKEADREANRQKRKLNFLISQTELYSHFIGKKVKTDEVERSTDDVAVPDHLITPALPGAHIVEVPDSVADMGVIVTNFKDLDFDAEDDTALRQAAMKNAQNAVQDAQNRARAFDNEGQTDFDEGEMNFQNPSSFGDVDIAQPKMLTCQLKEYQLKGLNWLVNLYEQGINGILADEMGLGKTIQSISVMAYLAEAHNIWGPFLVIAPASTLHNWQQEIVRFVPNLKVLPYWGNAKDRKVLRKFWDRKHITYNNESPFHVLVTSYQLVVQDTQYFQKIRWQYMILDEAQAIKSSQSSRWKSLLGFHCRNRLLLTGTPIQNNMQELWALLHFIMPSLFDSHDEFSDWFSKDIESHAQSNTKLNEDQLKRLHMILKPFMLRRIKKHVQKELGEKIEEDVFCDLTYRQRAYYSNLRNKISIMDLIEKVSIGDDQDTATLMNLVMQFRKVCNHPDLFERAEVMSPVSFSYFAETASFLREGHSVDVGYSVRNLIEFRIPKMIGRDEGRINIPGPENHSAGWRAKFLYHVINIWTPENVRSASAGTGAFSWLRFLDVSTSEVSTIAHQDIFQRALDLRRRPFYPANFPWFAENGKVSPRTTALFDILEAKQITSRRTDWGQGRMYELMNISSTVFANESLNAIEPCTRPAASAPPIELYCTSQGVNNENQGTFFNVPIRSALYPISLKTEQAMLDAKLDLSHFPVTNLLPEPISQKSRYTKIQVPSMRRFVTDSGKLAKLDQLLAQLKEGGHRVLLYFQMTRMIDLMEEYLTYRNYKYCRLDGSTKLEDRRDTVADFQSRSDIFIFLLSTRAGGLGINLTAADTVIFYDSDWNPTIDSQAMDRAHRLGQTRQVTVYRMITRGTIEERIRRRALQKEEVQRVVISGGAGAAGGQVDFNTRSTRETRTKDIALWLADEDQAKEIERKEKEMLEKEAKESEKKKGKKGVGVAGGKGKKEVSLDDMYHEGEGHFDDSSKPSGAATPVETAMKNKRKGVSKKAKSIKEKLAIADGAG